MFVLSLVYAILFLNKIKNKKFKVLFLLFLLIPISAISANLDTITGRSDIYDSIAIRMNIFSSFLEELIISPIKIFTSDEFGIATNTLVSMINTLNIDFDGAIIADSTFNSILKNTGFLSTIIFFLILFILALKNKKSRMFVIIYLTFSITTIIFEAFPMNLIFSLNIAYFFMKTQENINEHSPQRS